MANRDQAYTVYYRLNGHRRWQERDFTSVEASTTWVTSNLAVEDEIYLYENNVWFSIKGNNFTGDVIFWWNEACLDEMEQEPQGRGFGWSDDHDCFVQYQEGQDELDQIGEARGAVGPWDTFAATAVVPQSSPAVSVTTLTSSRHDEVYDEVSCYACGKHVAQNMALADSIEVLSGRTTGTRSRSSSQGSRTGSSWGSSRSTSYGTSVRSTSGRSYYRTEHVFFCSEVCRQKQYAETISEKPLLEQAIWLWKRLRLT